MSLSEREYKQNQAILKDYGGTFYKLTAFKWLKTSGIETNHKRPKGTVNDKKMVNNVSRARSKVFELSKCNHWTYWATFTLDQTKYDRFNLDQFRKDFTHFIRNKSAKYGCKIHYLLVPELHADGAWHMHGFIEGLPIDELRPFTLDEKLPHKMRDKLKKGQPLFDWTSYGDKFGFNDLEYVRNIEAASIYITTYLTKLMDVHVTELGKHLYYASRGLKLATELKRGTIVSAMIPKYENEYVRVQEFTSDTDVEELKKMILD